MIVGPNPFVATAYGRLVYDIANILSLDKDNLVMVSGMLWCGSATRINNFYMLPEQVTPMKRFDPTFLTRLHIERYKPHIILTIGDLFVYKYLERKKAIWCAYFPLDGRPAQRNVLDLLARIQCPIVPSKFSKEVLLDHGCEPVYIPHHVDPNVFFRYSDEDRKKLRKYYQIPEDVTVLGFVGQNTSRKKIPRLLEAFKKMKQKTKEETLLWLHSSRYDESGYQLPEVIKSLGLIEDLDVRFTPWIDELSVGVSELNRIYNLFDIYVSASSGEGFGLPHLESMQIGIPNIAVNYSSMIELLEDVGILCKVQEYDMDKFNTYRALVDIDDLANSMKTLVEDKKMREHLGQLSIERAKKYEISKIAKKWLRLFRLLG